MTVDSKRRHKELVEEELLAYIEEINAELPAPDFELKDGRSSISTLIEYYFEGSTNLLTAGSLRLFACPFDWMFSNYFVLADNISSNFKKILNKKY